MKKNETFEGALRRLDEIVSRLDQGEAPLEESLKLFGEGAELIAFCSAKLEGARQKVETLFPEPEEERADDLS